MTERVTVKVKAGQMLTAPDGRLIQAGETVAVSPNEAAFFERMGAAQVVPAPEPAPEPDKPAKKAKNV